jgi:hypothetical protein
MKEDAAAGHARADDMDALPGLVNDWDVPNDDANDNEEEEDGDGSADESDSAAESDGGVSDADRPDGHGSPADDDDVGAVDDAAHDIDALGIAADMVGAEHPVVAVDWKNFIHNFSNVGAR